MCGNILGSSEGISTVSFSSGRHGSAPSLDTSVSLWTAVSAGSSVRVSFVSELSLESVEM